MASNQTLPLHKQDWIYTAAYAWLGLPIMLFVFGWLRPIVSLPMAALLLYGFWKVCMISDPKPGIDFRSRYLWIGLGLILCWLILSGIGGYLWQNPWDHTYRNAIYSDLANRTWPVTGEEEGHPEMLSYYFGFWLPSALMARITGIAEIGYVCQVVYAAIGVYLSILMVYRYIGSTSLWVPILFMFFSGCDVVGFLLFKHPSVSGIVFAMKDSSYGWFSSPSTTIQLYFIYNQGVAAWLVMMLLLKQRENPGALLFTFCLLPLFSPIVAAGIAIPVGVGLVLGKRRSLTWANLGGLLLGMVLAMFYMANQSAGGVGFYDIGTPGIVASYIAFFLLTYVIYMPFVWDRIRRNALFWLLFVPLPFLVWICLGDNLDFAWRCTIGCSFYLMLLIMKELVAMGKKWHLRKALLIAVLCVALYGSITVVVNSMYQDFRHFREGRTEFRVDSLPTTFMPNMFHDSFVCERKGHFVDWLMKNPE